MSNITLSIPDEVLDDVRIIAAEQRTSVNALVRDYLAGLSKHKKLAKRAMAELRSMSEKTEARLGPDFKFDRDSLYER
jgi:hypothetical protein